ncbi:MAG: hypothetical protein P8M22_08630 [Phycisphaerales bacterium]|nr:hypothetical protein [Phycisphaerales bacterium]
MSQYLDSNQSQPIEEDDQMEYGFLDEAMDDDEAVVEDSEEDDEAKETADDDPDNLDREDD